MAGVVDRREFRGQEFRGQTELPLSRKLRRQAFLKVSGPSVRETPFSGRKWMVVTPSPKKARHCFRNEVTVPGLPPKNKESGPMRAASC
jgi:hypothetical protein